MHPSLRDVRSSELGLGLGAYVARFTGVPLPLGQSSVLAIPVAHRLNGGLLLVASLVSTLHAFRVRRARPQRLGVALVSKRAAA